MKARTNPWATAALLAALASAACGGVGPVPETAPPETAPPADADAAAETPDLAELEALYRARVDSARMRFTEADVRFLQDMIVHHGQALVMARLTHTREASPAIRRLAERIRIGQEDEIALMRRWLRDRDQPAPELEIEGTRLTVRGIHEDSHRGAAHGMHGMLTAEQLRELGEARGREFDRLFLARMIEHHRGAVTMVRELFGTAGAARDPELFRLAADIQVDQLTEIARMERMLEEILQPERNRE